MSERTRMNIPLLDLKAQYQGIKKEVDDIMLKVVERQNFILSREVSDLEREIAEYVGVSHAAGVASGTDALILAMRAAGIGEGDLVITTPFTFFATSESISILGAKPVFVEIDPGTYNIDPAGIEALLRDTRYEIRDTIKAIIPVHLYGQCADMARIMAIADEHGLKVIEDCAQAIGATHKGRQAGSFGAAGCMSFFPSKNLGGFGDGGMVVSPDASLIEHVKKLRAHGSNEQYIHEEIGYNSRLDSLQAAILRVKFKKLDAWFEKRRAIAKRYDETFSPLGITVPQVAEGNVHTYHQYTIALDDRDGLRQHLKARGVAARAYYPVPLHLQPCYRSLGYSAGAFPVSEKAAKKVLSLPVYPELSDEEVEYIIGAVKDFVSGK
ncbi:MAG: DegT/DnrJ/EryC1/StrS family aminotransferase [Candidatus Omnitrophota bacterium]|nr:DegT/DnrJ/EryC1/StrS family aminotransferase [Candidatus Omnitrophota bacterium]